MQRPCKSLVGTSFEGCLENVSCTSFIWDSVNKTNFRRPRETPEDFAQKKETLDKISEMRKGSSVDSTAHRAPRSSTAQANSRDPRFIKTEDSDGRGQILPNYCKNFKSGF